MLVGFGVTLASHSAYTLKLRPHCLECDSKNPLTTSEPVSEPDLRNCSPKAGPTNQGCTPTVPPRPQTSFHYFFTAHFVLGLITFLLPLSSVRDTSLARLQQILTYVTYFNYGSIWEFSTAAYTFQHTPEKQ